MDMSPAHTLACKKPDSQAPAAPLFTPPGRISRRAGGASSQSPRAVAAAPAQSASPLPTENAMNMSPLIAVHASAALAAVVTGPIALWARKGAAQRPKLHRAFGYAWVTLMLVAATSAIFISGDKLPHIAGFGPIHVLIPVTYGMLFLAFRHLARGNIAGHRRAMQRLYFGGCILAGGFTLLPDRLLGTLVLSLA
jgi:uncharacterized membrane protein